MHHREVNKLRNSGINQIPDGQPDRYLGNSTGRRALTILLLGVLFAVSIWTAIGVYISL